MRVLFVVALTLACVAPAWAKGDSATAKAANARGMALYKQQDYKGAATQFRAALAADAAYLQAHYNLACVSSLLHDEDVAMDELEWIGNRASWDEQAKAKALKAANDHDLEWILNKRGDAHRWIGPDATTAAVDLLDPKRIAIAGTLLAESQRAKAMQALSAMPGKHDDNCDPKDAKQGRVFGLDTTTTVGDPTTPAFATLRDGIGIFDATGKLLARSGPLGCTTPGASQDILSSFAIQTSTDASADGCCGSMNLFVVQYSNGGRSQWTNEVAIFAKREQKFARVFEATVSSSDATGGGRLLETRRGELVFTAPDEKRPRLFRWDQTAFKFVAAE